MLPKTRNIFGFLKKTHQIQHLRPARILYSMHVHVCIFIEMHEAL